MAANHPQLGAALSNIAELNRVYLEHQRESLREAEAGSRGSEKSAKNPKKHARYPANAKSTVTRCIAVPL